LEKRKDGGVSRIFGKRSESDIAKRLMVGDEFAKEKKKEPTAPGKRSSLGKEGS